MNSESIALVIEKYCGWNFFSQIIYSNHIAWVLLFDSTIFNKFITYISVVINLAIQCSESHCPDLQIVFLILFLKEKYYDENTRLTVISLKKYLHQLTPLSTYISFTARLHASKKYIQCQRVVALASVSPSIYYRRTSLLCLLLVVRCVMCAAVITVCTRYKYFLYDTLVHDLGCW